MRHSEAGCLHSRCFAAAYRAQLDRALAAWADPAVWDRELDMMGAKTPAADVGAELFRQYKGFADPVPTAADAPILDRVLAPSGRNPAWAPSAH